MLNYGKALANSKERRGGFNTTVERFKPACGVSNPGASDCAPGPGSYDINKVQNGILNDTTKGKWREKTDAFISNEKEIKLRKKIAFPGPGSYNIDKSERCINKLNNKGLQFAKSERFENLGRNTVPGPGDYDISNEFGNIKTFNKTLS